MPTVIVFLLLRPKFQASVINRHALSELCHFPLNAFCKNDKASPEREIYNSKGAFRCGIFWGKRRKYFENISTGRTYNSLLKLIMYYGRGFR
ncbi:MAG: hypothetical protein CRN43_18320 [Candidatus Nephrothrix sp. EaCA]|nr:MAG: hypothetical protein CRN43_18320 [Candidatus Nephrothrix sp. EaCA]